MTEKCNAHQNGVRTKYIRSLLVRQGCAHAVAAENHDGFRVDYFFLRAAALRGFVGAAAKAAGFDGWSPMTPLSGQILKAGHFWQPATMAIGQMVMGTPVDGEKQPSMRGAGLRK
jgi:hypothetical protein